MNLKALFAVFALAFIAPLPAHADFWNHNGSVVRIAEGDGGLFIDYHRPRAGLAEIGVRPETRLFQGNFVSGNEIVGTAYTFKKGCQPAAYDVVGEMQDGYLRLVGYAPIRAKQGCHVIGYNRNKNSILEFYWASPEGE